MNYSSKKTETKTTTTKVTPTTTTTTVTESKSVERKFNLSLKSALAWLKQIFVTIVGI
jgi:hypothetical protein